LSIILLRNSDAGKGIFNKQNKYKTQCARTRGKAEPITSRKRRKHRNKRVVKVLHRGRNTTPGSCKSTCSDVVMLTTDV